MLDSQLMVISPLIGGDGNIINYDGISQTSALYRVNHEINWDDIDPSTLTSEGYRQAIVKVTPQVPGTLTKFDLVYAYQSERNVAVYSDILDIKMAGQNISILRIGSSSHPKMEQFEFVGSHNITNGTSLFYGSKIKKLVSFDMTNITTVNSMFNSCSNLIELPEGFNTSNFTSCNSMFQNCYSLEKLSLDLSSCTSTSSMFNGCSSLIEVDLQNTGNVTNAQNMFTSCGKLETVKNLDISSVTNCSNMFQYCSNLFYLPQLDFTSCTTTYYMFHNCSSIIKFDNGLINTSGIQNMSTMFYGCSNLIEIPKDFNTDGCTVMTNLFGYTTSLRRIPVINTSNVTLTNSMFLNSSIEEITDMDLSSVTNCNQMFKSSKIKSLPLLDLSSCTNTSYMFNGCQNIKEINLTNTSNVTNGQYMFTSCGKLESITGLDTSSVTNHQYMFQNCYKLKNLSLLDFQNSTSTKYMFNNCQFLEEFPNGLINTSGVTDMSVMFYDCYSLKEIPSDFNTDSATNMTHLFRGCRSLKTIPSINTSNITSTYNIFYGSGLEIIPDLDFSNVTYGYGTFDWCTNLRKIGNIDMSSITSNSYMLRNNHQLSESNIFGLTKSHSYNTNKFSRLGLINIFNNLGNASSQTIDVRNNPGTADLTPEDIAIATSKGWTVTV